LEVSLGAKVASFLTLKGNISLSRSKTDYNDFVETTSEASGNDTSIWQTNKNVDISFSPRVVAGTQIIYTPFKTLEVALLSKYISSQYLDNTQNELRILKAYWINDLRINYKLSIGVFNEIEFKLLVNNLFNVKYNSNGYMYDTTPYYYPQALRNFMFGISIGI
jgi:iron complex outermembrane receptor protein